MQLPEELTKAVRELKEYFLKSRTKFTVRVNLPYGSDFQRHVWQELQKIPYGTTVSYEDIALALTGNDRVAARNLSRAVGSACSDNPIPILIPCHRVIGKDGRLVGFSGGVENKEFLLDHEILGFSGMFSNHGKAYAVRKSDRRTVNTIFNKDNYDTQ
jgi:O-6-methylguanine DNA methyltransferase